MASVTYTRAELMAFRGEPDALAFTFRLMLRAKGIDPDRCERTEHLDGRVTFRSLPKGVARRIPSNADTPDLD